MTKILIDAYISFEDKIMKLPTASISSTLDRGCYCKI